MADHDQDLTPEAAAEAYFDAWQHKDVEGLRPLMAPDVTFVGTLGRANGVDEVLAGLSGLAAATTSLEVHQRLAGPTDVMTWFELAVGGSEPTPTVNWTTVEDGRIVAVRVTFDPRPILAVGDN